MEWEGVRLFVVLGPVKVPLNLVDKLLHQLQGGAYSRGFQLIFAALQISSIRLKRIPAGQKLLKLVEVLVHIGSYIASDNDVAVVQHS